MILKGNVKMKSKVPGRHPLTYLQTADSLQAWARSFSITMGVLTALLVMAFLGMIVRQAVMVPEDLLHCVSWMVLTLLFFGFIPVFLLRRQQLTLDDSGLESRFYFCGFPICRNFVSRENIVSLDSQWDGGSDDGACMRLLIRTTAGETLWGIDADDDSIISIAKRLSHFLRQMQKTHTR